VNTLEGAGPSDCEMLHGAPDLDAVVTAIKSKRMTWTEHVIRLGENKNACRVLVAKPEGSRLLRRPRRTWEDNIEMDLKINRIG
jgi:hypothetical protein